MQILHVTQGYSPAIGGTELVLQCVSEELVRQFGDDVTVFTTNCYSAEAFFQPRAPCLPVGVEVINGVRVRRFPVRRSVSRLLRLPQFVAYHLNLPFNDYVRTLSRGPLVPGLAQAICTFPADLVAASSFPLWHMFVAQRSARQSRKACVLFGGLHPDDVWGFQRGMIYRAIRQADAYIANTGFEADYVIQRGALPERVYVIGVGVDVDLFARIPTREAKRWLGTEGFPVVGFIGQLGGHKGVSKLVQAMPRVWAVVPEARCLIAGARTLFAEYVEDLIRQLPAQDRHKLILRYNFPEEDKPWLFAASDVVAYPSGYESFGVTFLEGWAAGKPVIGCRRGSTPWVIQAGRDGLLVEYQNEEMLADAIILLFENPSWASALGQAGHKKVLERYTWRTIAQRFREVYQVVLQERRRTNEGE
jgi:glycosyltransferase involved in cell wall biosynthesis